MKTIEGCIDIANKEFVSGWARSLRHNNPVVIEVTANEKKYAGMANIIREDLLRSNIHPTGRCGFKIRLPGLLLNKEELEIKAYAGEDKVELNRSPIFLNSDIKKKKIFFLHIPKAAGSSLNSIFSNKFQSDKQITHIESSKLSPEEIIQSHNFVSGHIPLYKIRKNYILRNFLRVTLVRDPFKQLISHLNWVRNLSEDTNSQFFRNHPKAIQNISLRLKAINLSEPNELGSFISSMSDDAYNLFNNCQTRYLLPNEPMTHITEDMADHAIKGSEFFDVIGVVEQYEKFLNSVFTQIGWEETKEIKKENVLSNKFKINDTNHQLRELMQPLICADQKIYDHIKK